VRYTQETLGKKNVSEAERQLEQVRRAVGKLPDGPVKIEQEAVLSQLEADVQGLESMAEHAATTRQLERELKSTRETIQRAGGSMSPDSHKPYPNMCRTTMAKLPAELQSIYRDEWKSLVCMTGASVPKEAVPTGKFTIGGNVIATRDISQDSGDQDDSC
jgi:hypothetical protein